MTNHSPTTNDNVTPSTYDKAVDSASRVYHDAQEKVAEALEATKHATKDVAHRAATEIETNPFTVLIGGIAVGALAGALLPRSRREKELLAPVGRKLGDTARQAFAAAREAGKQELDQAGITPGAARERGREMLDGVVKALSSAGTAATQATKKTEGA